MSAPFRPDFIVIGAAKSGTTSLCAILVSIPICTFPNPIEPQFFSFDKDF